MSFTDRRGHYKETSCWSFHPCSQDWPTHLPRLLPCRRWDPGTPMAVTTISLSKAGGNHACRSWLPKPDPLKGTGRAEGAHQHQPPTPTLQPKPREKRLVMQQGSMQAVSPQCFLKPDFIRCTAQASPFPRDI